MPEVEKKDETTSIPAPAADVVPSAVEGRQPEGGHMDENPVVKAFGELKSSMDRHFAIADARNIDLARRMDDRDRADAEFRGHMKGAMTTLQERVARMESQVPALQQEAQEAKTLGRAAMKSHDDLHRYVHDVYDEQHAEVMARLDKQDEDRDRIEQEKRENREKESIAAKKLAADRTHQENRQRIWAPVLQAIAVALVAAAGTFAATMVANSNTEAKVDAVNRKIDSHTEAIEEMRQAVTKDLPGALPSASAATLPPAPPARTK